MFNGFQRLLPLLDNNVSLHVAARGRVRHGLSARWCFPCSSERVCECFCYRRFPECPLESPGAAAAAEDLEANAALAPQP